MFFISTPFAPSNSSASGVGKPAVPLVFAPSRTTTHQCFRRYFCNNTTIPNRDDNHFETRPHDTTYALFYIKTLAE